MRNSGGTALMRPDFIVRTLILFLQEYEMKKELAKTYSPKEFQMVRGRTFHR